MDIFKEVKAVIDTKMLDSLIFYFYEHREEKQEWAATFKEVFCNTIDNLIKEVGEEE